MSEKSQDRASQPKMARESSPKKHGYGTDRIGGGQSEFTGGVKELEKQGNERHHVVDKGSC